MRRPRSLVVNPVATPVALWCLALLAGLFSVPPSARVDEQPLLFAGSVFCLLGFAVSVTLALPWLWLRADQRWIPREDGFIRPPEGARTSSMNRACMTGLVLNSPVNWVVMVATLRLPTPRMDMQV